MIRHIVFLKSSEKDAKRKSEIIIELADKLTALEKLISEIQSIDIGINISKSESTYNISLLTTFNSEDDLNTYRYHTEHIKVIDYIKNNNIETTAVDSIY